ncbi:MAG: sensor histidine kinase [Lachnospiraceae bacterium]|nr:sensor histidine kinase [Lachnospiraceae bacterium]
MKTFIRTPVGKSFLLFLNVISVIMVMGCIGVAVFDVTSDVYSKSKGEAIFDVQYDLDINNEGALAAIREQLPRETSTKMDSGGTALMDFVLEDKNNKVLLSSTDVEKDLENTAYVSYSVKDGMIQDVSVRAEDDAKEYKKAILYYSIHDDPLDYSYHHAKILGYMYDIRYIVYPVGVVFGLLVVVTFVLLLCFAGRNKNGELEDSPIWKIPYDLELLFYIMVAGTAGGIATTSTGENAMFFGIVAIILDYIGLLCVLMSGAARIKNKVLVKRTLTYKIWTMLVFPFQHLDVLKRVMLALGLLTVLEGMVIYLNMWNGDATLAFWFVEKIVLVPFILRIAYEMNQLQTAGRAIAKGEENVHMDTKKLHGALKEHGENLNNVAEGIHSAVEKQMQSERLKTEMITNVSHDLKTPLTSIVNYADLIGKEECDNEKIKEYSEVLLRQSTRMKRLIEDLVEVSKANTGNLDVALEPCNMGVFLDQTQGEYIEKLQKANLELFITKPEKEIQVMADGRRMWRIFDNLMNNICKYAKEDTRVYIDLNETEENVQIVFKNISKEPLNISPKELMERFVRGDKSRNTEGNGLGLSIAESLARLQNGQMELFIDGDLFKVVLQFPKI